MWNVGAVTRPNQLRLKPQAQADSPLANGLPDLQSGNEHKISDDRTIKILCALCAFAPLR